MNKDSKRLITPRLDKILAEAGWHRPNEAPVYWRKNPDPKWKYKVTQAMDVWYVQEKWFDAHPGLWKYNHFLEQFEKCFENTFCASEKIRDKCILENSADFYFWEGEGYSENYKKYENLYNNFK